MYISMMVSPVLYCCLSSALLLTGRPACTVAADLYIRLFDALLDNPETVSHGHDGYFFVENGEFSMVAVLTAVADALFALGRIPSGELVSRSDAEMGAYYGSPVRAETSA